MENSQWIDSEKNIDLIYQNLLYTSRSKNNQPADNASKANVMNLAKTVRYISECLGEKILLGSGYRNPNVNASVGGSKTSQHMLGQAVDMELSTSTDSADNWRLFLFIVNSPQFKNKFDQIIWEKYGNWVHISFVWKSANCDVTKDENYSSRKRITLYDGHSYTTMTPKIDESGYYCFDVKGLSGRHYTDINVKNVNPDDINNLDFSDDVKKSNIQGNDNFSTQPVEQRERKASSRGGNEVFRLGDTDMSNKYMEGVVDARKDQFLSMQNTLIKNAPNIGRKIYASGEMYNPSIKKEKK